MCPGFIFRFRSARIMPVTGMFGGGVNRADTLLWVHTPTVPAKSNPVGGHSICPRCMEVYSNNRRWEQACAIRRTKRKFRANGRGNPSPTNYWFLLGVGARKPLPEGALRATIGRPPENNSPFRLSRHFSAKSQKTPFFSRVDRSTNFCKRLDTGRETCYNVLTCRGAAFSPSRAGSAARGFNAGRLG